jgi:hypothetical protein
MSWGAQNRSKDAKTPIGSRGRSDKPEPGLWPVQPYYKWASNCISLLLILDTLDQIRRRARATKDLELELGHARASSAAMTYDMHTPHR